VYSDGLTAQSVMIDHEIPMLLPPDLRECTPEDSMLILETYVTNHANDKLVLNAAKHSVDPEVRPVSTVYADTG
jgi:hypothetical protein